MQIFDFISVFFDKIWDLFQIEFPGIGVSFAGIGLGALFIVGGLRLLGSILGLNMDVVSTFKGADMGTGGNNKNIKVSDKRKGDRF